MIDKFSKQQFEQALFNIFAGYESLGLIAGEECYAIPVNNHTRLTIRSSIDKSGYAADTGQDSIRLWLEVYKPAWNNPIIKWQAVSKKVDAYTTRVSGWEERLESKIRILWQRAAKIRQAPTTCDCNKSPNVFFVRKEGKNKGRPFQSCRSCNFFEWLDITPTGKIDFKIVDESSIDKNVKGSADYPPPAPEPIFDFETLNVPKPEITFEPSEYQKAIFNFVENGTGHGICEAVAGSGKTTTNIQALQYLPDSINAKFLAFNRHIANELQDKGVDIADTFHSLGKGNIINSMPNAKFNQYKAWNACDVIEVGMSYEEKAQIAKIIGLIKGNLLEPTTENVEDLINNFPSLGTIEEDNKLFIIRTTVRVFEECEKNTTEYDFDDMIYWSAIDKVGCQKFDFIFVDEAQDLNKAQITMAEKSLSENGRMLLIGDPHQSIYAFRGAFVGIMEYMQERLQATQLPLTISYRAPLAVVNLVNQKFPHIKFEAFENAKEGKIDNIGMDQFLEEVQPGDGIICRTNAPLVKPCFALIKEGKKAMILGRNIGKGLVSLVNKRAKLKRVQNLSDNQQLPQLISELYVYLTNEKPKLQKAHRYGAIQLLEDQIDTIIAISDDCQNINELKAKIKSTFSDNQDGVVFSSIHKAKGLEWDSVYILKPNLLPHPMAKTSSEKIQEKNLEYVAITRSKENLFFVYD